MRWISLRLINAMLIVGYSVICALHIEPVETLRQYFGILLAGWAILHTERLRRANNWRFEFVELPPDFIKLCHYLATAFLIVAAIYYWLLPVSVLQRIAAILAMISLSMVWLKMGVTSA